MPKRSVAGKDRSSVPPGTLRLARPTQTTLYVFVLPQGILQGFVVNIKRTKPPRSQSQTAIELPLTMQACLSAAWQARTAAPFRRAHCV